MQRKKRRKLELLAGDLREVLNDPDAEDRGFQLFDMTYDIAIMMHNQVLDPEKVGILIDLAKLTRQSRGPGVFVAEEKLLGTLESIVWDCGRAFLKVGIDGFLTYPRCPECPAELEQSCRVLCCICDYALDIFSFKKPRDQLAGTRRACALVMLGAASRIMDIPDALPHALAVLKRNRKYEVQGALEFFESYLSARKSVPPEIEQQLLRFAENADNRMNVVGSLNALVEAGNISECEALELLDDWQSYN